MRLRSIPYLLVTLVSWFLVWRFVAAVRATPFGDELGSIAFPLPGYVRVALLGGLLSATVGLPMLLVDFVRWARKGKHD